VEENILDMIERDHQDLLRQTDGILTRRSPTEATLDPKFSVFQQFFLAHMNAENAILYPLLDQRYPALTAALYREHEAIKDGMQDLASRWHETTGWDREVRDLLQYIERHLNEEERQVSEAVREILSEDELLTLGEEYEERMRESASRRVGPGRAETAG